MIAIVAMVFWLWMIFDFFQKRSFEDGIWTIVVFLSPLGALLYFFAYYLPSAVRASGGKGRRNRFQQLSNYDLKDLSPLEANELGDKLLARGECEKAALCYEQVLRSMPERYSASVDLASCYIQTKRMDEAISHLEKVPLSASPYGERAAMLLGKCRLMKGDTEGALKAFQSIERSEGSFEFKYLYAQTLAKSRMKDDAERILNQIVRHGSMAARNEKHWVGKAKAELSRLNRI